MPTPSFISQGSTLSLPSGTRLEEFVIEKVLGIGGFGITYLAKDSSLGRRVVIKENLPAQFCWRDTQSLTVRPRHTAGEEAENFQYSLESFRQEASTLASLDHPGIVKVLRSFMANDTAYFVMPFVEGTALDEVIQRKTAEGAAFTEEDIRDLLSKVLDALGYLHDRGIYHRDIKPGNILITKSGPVLIDFGAARQRLSERSLTVIESAGYTPFEQLQSRGKIGPWSDIYALGCTLYKVITGETPAKATDRIMDDPVVPLAKRNDLQGRCSQALLASIDKAMAPKATDRFQEVQQWKEAVEGPDRAAASESDHDKPVASFPHTLPSQEVPKPGSLHEEHCQFLAEAEQAMARNDGSKASQLLKRLGNKRFVDLDYTVLAGYVEHLERRKNRMVYVILGIGALVMIVIISMAMEGAKTSRVAQEQAEREKQPSTMSEAEKKSSSTDSHQQRLFENTLGMKFVPVPGSQVMMCLHETRNVDYAAYAAAQSGVDEEWRSGAESGKEQHPVVKVNYEDAEGFCRWLSAKEGKTYRLPTDAEWSAAVGLKNEKGETPREKSQNGQDDVFPWGSYYPPKPVDGNYKLDEVEDGYDHTAPVMRFRPNKLGLYDMGGNAEEWCQDWYGIQDDRVLRGASWYVSARVGLRSSYRSLGHPMFRYGDLGFRCVLVVSGG